MIRHSRSATAVAFLLVLTEAVYLRPSILMGRQSLAGMDFDSLHFQRIAYARDALFGARHTLPQWYSNEFLGAPFAGNLQSFPWIPTRLALFLLDPALAFAAGVAIAAALAAVFTYLYCRRAGLSQVGAAAAAWTFACAGYFTSRIAVGHLPLLEAYPALPLLLWLADRALSPQRAARHGFDLGALAVASACVAVAGHPQVPAYALATALLYVAWRGRGWLRARLMAAMALGVGATLVVWWPMLLLIGRSTRVLELSTATNDISLTYRRVLALVCPGLDGWPDAVTLAAQHPFHGYANDAHFWDTIGYVGILPLLAILILLVDCVAKSRLPRGRWMFLAAVGLFALLFATSLAGSLRQLIPGTFLRSPSRLLYLFTFCAAVALGVAVDRALAMPKRALVATCLALHFLDLSWFAHWFIQPASPPGVTREFESILARDTGNGRIAPDRERGLWYGPRYDDVGAFDSIFLAQPYRAIAALNGLPPNFNEQDFDGSRYSVAALEATGVRFVISAERRSDLELVSRSEDLNLYRVSNPAPRAAFFAENMTEILPEEKILERFVSHPRAERLLLPEDARKYVTRARAASVPGQAAIRMFRPSSDEILLETDTAQPGFVSVLEAYDPGWKGSVDGKDAPVVRANGFSMAIPVIAGKHSVRMRYQLPGRLVGGGFSGLSLGLLMVLIWVSRRGRNCDGQCIGGRGASDIASS